MIAGFEFATSARILFGAGKRHDLPALLREFGVRRVLCVTGGSAERAQPILDLITSAGAQIERFAVTGEPDLVHITTGRDVVRRFAPDAIVAVGGGSVIDTGKALAALEANDGDVLDYLEVIGAGRALPNAVRIPVIALPTTAGTGSEVTRNAVIASPEHRLKVSLRHRSMLPAVALIDPELTYDLPRAQTAYTGMDALVQLIEPYLSNAATPITDALSLHGLTLGVPALPRCIESPHDADARAAMACASLFGGMALANAKLGAVHGFAGVIGGMFDAPHGALCARLLPPVLEANISAITTRAPGSEAARRLGELRALIDQTHPPQGTSGDALIDWAWGMTDVLSIPPLSAYGVRAEHLDDIARKSAGANSMKGNPIPLTHAELVGVLERAL